MQNPAGTARYDAENRRSIGGRIGSRDHGTAVELRRVPCLLLLIMILLPKLLWGSKIMSKSKMA